MHIRRQHRQCHRSREPCLAFLPHPVQAPLLQIVDRRLHCRMRLPPRPELLRPFSLPVRFRQPPLLRQHRILQQSAQRRLPPRTPESRYLSRKLCMFLVAEAQGVQRKWGLAARAGTLQSAPGPGAPGSPARPFPEASLEVPLKHRLGLRPGARSRGAGAAVQPACEGGVCWGVRAIREKTGPYCRRNVARHTAGTGPQGARTAR